MFKLLKHYIKLKIMTKYGEMAAYYYKAHYKGNDVIYDNIKNKLCNISNNRSYLTLKCEDLELIAMYSYSKVCNPKIIP